MNSVTQTKQTRSQVLPKEYVVIVHTVDTDEHGAPWGRAINVVWDAGITPDWEDWMENFNSLEDEPYELKRVVEVDPSHVDEM
jgi:hypothetical protein